METVGKRKPRPRRSFTPEFKAEIVEACRRGDRTIGQVARDFDLTETAVPEWVRRADIDDGHREGLTTAEREELAQLRRENRRLRHDVEILRRGGCRTNPDHPARVSGRTGQSEVWPTTSSLLIVTNSC